MDLDLRLVRYFVAVADDLHFGRAAAKLYISQPALSRQIRRLEEQVGAPLLVRDSRHVLLTAAGERFLADARQLLAIAQNMKQVARPGALRIAHIFELDTSRAVVDAYLAASPDVEVLEHAMDSQTQLEALLQHRLDVAILRITPRMLLERPSGWSRCLLRLEPMVLVGRADDPPRLTASLLDGALEVFGDPPESGSYNAHGTYLTALELDLGVTMRWLGTPGAFSHCLGARFPRADARTVARIPQLRGTLCGAGFSGRHAGGGAAVLPLVAGLAVGRSGTGRRGTAADRAHPGDAQRLARVVTESGGAAVAATGRPGIGRGLRRRAVAAGGAAGPGRTLLTRRS